MMKMVNLKRNQKIKPFLFFLFLAASIWFLTKFSKPLVAVFNMDLIYQGLPEQTMLSADAPKQIQISVKANGFKLIAEYFKTKALSVDLSAGRVVEDDKIRFNQDQLLALCYRKMPQAGMISMETKELIVSLDRMSAKTVHVKFNGSLSLAQGYKMMDSALINPRSITIYGPSELIDSITEIKTRYVDLTELKSGKVQSLALEPLEGEALSRSQDSIQWSAEILEFTQKQITLPVEIVNVPKGMSLQIFPEAMTLTIEIPVEAFGQYDRSNFSLICDYNERISEDSFMIPKLKNIPERVFKPELSHKKVDYVEFTQ